MSTPYFTDLVENIACIDTGYYRPNLAACYLINHGGVAAFVDTGTYYSVPRLLETLKIKNIPKANVAYVMPTHVHLDHAGGVGELMRQLPNASLVVHPRGARHLIDPQKLTASAVSVYGEEAFKESFGQLIPVPEERVIIAEDETSLDLNGRSLLFLDTPGHARHHYSVYDETSNGFFTGDTFGLSYRELDYKDSSYIFPTTTPVQFDPEAWHDSIDRYLTYNPQRMYLTHFSMVGNVPKLAEELHRKIDKLVEIAREADGARNRHQRILEAMTNFLMMDAMSTNPSVNLNDCRALYALDLELNTQGLEVWLDREASK